MWMCLAASIVQRDECFGFRVFGLRLLRVVFGLTGPVLGFSEVSGVSGPKCLKPARGSWDQAGFFPLRIGLLG